MAVINSKTFRHAAVIFIVSLLYLAATAGGHKIFTRGEGREAIVVQSMLETSDYVLPLRNGSEIPSKPPLFHWISSAVASIDGELSEASVRAPSVIATVSLIFCSVVFFSTVLAYPQLATLLTLLVFMSSFEAMRAAAHGRVDALFAATITLSCFSLFALLENIKSRKSFALLVLSVSSLILAGLAKGPAGILIPGFICALYILLNYWSGRNKVELVRSVTVLALTGIVATLGLTVWYYLAYLRHGVEFLQVQLYDENLARLFNLPTSGAYSESLGHEKPFYFSILYFVVGFLPWSLLLPTYATLLYRRIKAGKLMENRFYLFALIWVATFLLAVTISSSKRSVYFLPCYPALAYLLIFEINAAGSLQNQLPFKGQLAAVIKWLSIVLFTLLAILLGALLRESVLSQIIGQSSINPDIAQAIIKWRLTLAAAIVLILPANWFILRSSKLLLESQWSKCIAVLAGALLLINLAIAQLVNPLLSALYSPQRFLEQIASKVKNQPLYQYRDNFYAAIFYAKRPLPMVKDLSQLEGGSGYLLASVKSLDDFDKEKYQVVAVSDELAANQKAKLALIKIGES